MICSINEMPIYYEEYGDGKPILCLHGYPEDHSVMVGCIEPVLQNISGYKRIYMDLPGMGKTPVIPDIKNADDMLALVESFVSKVIGDETFLVIGQSYGGYLSLGLILHMQHKIDGVFLLCPCTVADKQNRKLPCKQVIFEDLNFTHNSTDADFNDFLEYSVISTAQTWERYKNEILCGLQLADSLFTETYQNHGYCFTFEPEFKQISYDKPSCIILGRQDNCVGFTDTLDLINNFTRAAFTVADAAGHNLQIERAKLFGAHLEDWLDRI